jgi:hypothetical protein
MKARRAKKPKDIVARSITLQDSKGRTRIYMHADDDHTVIALYGKDGQSVQIADAPDGWLGMDIHDATGKVAIALSIRGEGRPGLSIMDHRSGMMSLIGACGDSPMHEVSIFQHGKLRWTSRRRSRKSSGR